MRIGIVCPYAWGVPGGVQFHIRDFSEELMSRGHSVSVLAPGGDDDEVPDYVVRAGRPVSVPYNGSVARILFGPRAAARVRRWLTDGDFDVVHIHEPETMSLGLLATWWADMPVVGTFHQATGRSRAMSAARGILQSAVEKLSARIAVSEEARRTLVQHLGGDAILIPNGLYVDRFDVPPRPEWRGDGGTLCFLGRVDEPRKGLRVLVAGPGDVEEARAQIPPEHRDAVTFLGGVSDEDKAAMLASSDIYVAPHTGGESFGIVLVEAMAAGAPVLASDLVAFRAVLDDGRLGALVPVGDADALAAEACALLADAERRKQYREAASIAVRRYDWSEITDEVLAVYEMVMAVGSPANRVFRMPRR
jgi:phosphatidyl-myo-inositol alpha-mannosyltransferase